MKNARLQLLGRQRRLAAYFSTRDAGAALDFASAALFPALHRKVCTQSMLRYGRPVHKRFASQLGTLIIAVKEGTCAGFGAVSQRLDK